MDVDRLIYRDHHCHDLALNCHRQSRLERSPVTPKCPLLIILMQIKDQLVLNIESMMLSGEGVARLDGLVYFVDGALRGEKVRAEITKVESNLIRANAVEILEPSPNRVKPVCDYFGECGGCVFQHLSYEQQLIEKRDALLGMFQHLGKLGEVSINPVIPSPKAYHYRNTVALSVRHQHDRPYLGFVRRDGHSFIPIEKCPIADEKLNTLFPEVLKKFKETVPAKKRYRTSQVVIRVGTDESFYTSIKSDSARILRAKVFDRVFEYTGSSFFQINYSILETMVKTVREFLNPSPQPSPTSGRGKGEGRAYLIDLYCGSGLFALSLASDYQSVVGIEEGQEAIKLAKENMKKFGIKNVDFLEGKAERLVEAVKNPDLNELHVVIDPPRVGLKKEVIDFLLKLPKVKKLVYVSCNPATMIRDLNDLSERFQVNQIQPIDLFPQTRHLETIAQLVCK